MITEDSGLPSYTGSAWQCRKVSVRFDGPQASLRFTDRSGNEGGAEQVKLTYQTLNDGTWSFTDATVEGKFFHQGEPTTLGVIREYSTTEKLPEWLDRLVAEQVPDDDPGGCDTVDNLPGRVLAELDGLPDRALRLLANAAGGWSRSMTELIEDGWGDDAEPAGELRCAESVLNRVLLARKRRHDEVAAKVEAALAEDRAADERRREAVRAAHATPGLTPGGSCRS